MWYAGTVFYVFAGLVGLAFFVLWLIALIDCARNGPSEPMHKAIWLLIILVGGIIGAALYVAIGKPARPSWRPAGSPGARPRESLIPRPLRRP